MDTICIAATAKSFVRRSMRRLSGRKPKRQRMGPDDTPDETKDNKNIIARGDKFASPAMVNPAFDDYDKDEEMNYRRQDSEHIDLSANDTAVITAGNVKYQSNQPKPVGYAYPIQNNTRNNPSPKPDSERSFPDSRGSTTSGSLYQDQSLGLTPSYDAVPVTKPRKPKNLNLKPPNDQHNNDNNVPEVIPDQPYSNDQQYRDYSTPTKDDRYQQISSPSHRHPTTPSDAYAKDNYNLSPPRADRYGSSSTSSPRTPSYDSNTNIDAQRSPRSPNSPYPPNAAESPDDRYRTEQHSNHPNGDRYGPPARDKYNTPTSSSDRYASPPANDRYGAPISQDRYNTSPGYGSQEQQVVFDPDAVPREVEI